jgi:hypothetical protein
MLADVGPGAENEDYWGCARHDSQVKVKCKNGLTVGIARLAIYII